MSYNIGTHINLKKKESKLENASRTLYSIGTKILFVKDFSSIQTLTIATA